MPDSTASGILSLETRVVDLLMDGDAFLRSVPRLGDLRAALRAVEKEWERQLWSDESKALCQALERCEQGQETLDAVAETIANEHFPLLENNLASKLCRAQPNPSGPQEVTDEITALCEDTFRAALGLFGDNCQSEFKRLAGYLISDRAVQEKDLDREAPVLNWDASPEVRPQAV